MTKFEDNISPYLSFVEGSAPSSPAATNFKLYYDSADHLLKWKNSAGTVTSLATNPMTTAGDIIYGGASGVPTRLAGGTSTYVLTSNGATSAPSWQVAAGGGGADVNHPLPLDSYAIDGTYGDDFTAASLSGSWTRRNYASGAETYQVGKKATYLRVSKASRAAGDGYFRTAPAGDWTFAMAFVPRFFGTVAMAWGVGVVDTNGTGVSTCFYSGPQAMLTIQVTTYSTYGGSYVQPGAAGTSPNIGVFPTTYWETERKVWVYLRKSGTGYTCAYSFDGEAWSPESGSLTWAGTVDRVAMMDAPLGSITSGVGTGSFVDVDWFNKIA